ncbi:MAG: DUF4177 domain-containing protein [Epulopiscium sp. Nele67-Bin005]|nr:MAG: DUF4177 domain-containing protein [Epulopiscium sp. Nele67-Bin005]
MYIYKSETLYVSTKWFTDKASANDCKELDDLLNKRMSEGWELVTYNYMATAIQVKGGFVITFRKLK